MFLFTVLWFHKFNSDLFFIYTFIVETRFLNEFIAHTVVLTRSDNSVTKEEDGIYARDGGMLSQQMEMHLLSNYFS